MATISNNPQYRNVGNLGDIIKHGALVAVVQELVRRSTGKMAYIDTHTFRLSAECPAPAKWESEVLAEKKNCPSYAEYIKCEQQIMNGGKYRCSSGLVPDLLVKMNKPYVTYLGEKDAETRNALEQQLKEEEQKNYILLEDAMNLATITSPGDISTLFMLVDPFELTDDLWSAVSSLMEKFLVAQADIVTEVFTFGKHADAFNWPEAPAPIGLPRYVIARKPYHLAMYSTPKYASLVDAICHSLHWTQQPVAVGTK